VGTQRLVAHRAYKNKEFEELALDDIGILVKDGCLQFPTMKQDALPRERVIAQLRSEGIDHLGKVKRLYMESNGSFTIKQNENAPPGLSILPDWDTDMIARQKKANDAFACQHCGNVAKGPRPPQEKCNRCGAGQWTSAVVSA